MRKFEGVTQQGGEGAENEFVLMSQAECKDLIRNYEEKTLKARIPRGEKPSDAQLSAVRSMLESDTPPAVNFAKFGPFSERAALMASRIADVIVDGVAQKRRVTGPSTIVEFIP